MIGISLGISLYAGDCHFAISVMRNAGSKMGGFNLGGSSDDEDWDKDENDGYDSCAYELMLREGGCPGCVYTCK